MRRVSFIGLLVMLNFATAGMGKYIDGENGKLAVSNVTSVLFLLVGVPCFFTVCKSLNKNLVGFFLLFNALASLSFLLYSFVYGWVPNFPVLTFQEVEIVFSLLLVWYAQKNFEEFLWAAKYGTYISVVISLYYGLQEVRAGEVLVLAFGMDDKSQAAVLFCCQAFVLIRYFGGALDLLLGGALMLMSLVTLSRLPVIFVPVIFLTFATKSRLGATIAGLASCVSVMTVLSAGDAVTQIFKVIDRLSSIDAVASDDATSAHLLLIETAFRLKFFDALSFFFGTGPGNFSKALTSFPIPLERLNAVDPSLINDAQIGRAPMHSTPLSALLDYSFIVFCLLGVFFIRGAYYLVNRHRYIEFIFLVSLFSASMFYSVHNKAYLFLLGTTIAIMVMPRASTKLAEDSVSCRPDHAREVFRHATTQNDTKIASETLANNEVSTQINMSG